MSIQDHIREFRRKLQDLDLGEVVHRLRANRRWRRARRIARKDFQQKRDHKLDTIHDLIKHGADPDSDRIKKLEREARRADTRVGELHTAIGRLQERIDELVPKVTWRRKRKHAILHQIRKLRKEARNQHADGDHLSPMDGKVGATWIVNIALAARRAGAWHGVAISLFRTPEYSESICYAQCGAPTCPGTCAGRASNHSCPPTVTCAEPEGAGDFSNPWELDAYCRAHNLPLIGNGHVLPNDVNHFSRSGR